MNTSSVTMACTRKTPASEHKKMYIKERQHKLGMKNNKLSLFVFGNVI